MKNELKIITDIVCNYYKVPTFKIGQKYRKKIITDCRKLIYFFSVKHTNYNYEDIAFYIARQEHCSVNYAIKVVKERLSYDKMFKIEFDELDKSIDHRLFGDKIVTEYENYTEIIHKSKGLLVK